MSDTDRLRLERNPRFAFGKNWRHFLRLLDDDRIKQAETSLTDMLDMPGLHGLRFLDIGCGSGLFSLAARRLGARVHSFDYDPHSVACTRELRERFFPDDRDWMVEEGSVLDNAYLKTLGVFDVVYAWGVLHHTGALWNALGNVRALIGQRGKLYLAIYNDAGRATGWWRRVKRLYCSGWLGKAAVSAALIPKLFLSGLIADLARLRNPIRRYAAHRKERGMSLYHDWIDWLGGYPYEVATPAEIVEHYGGHGLRLCRWKAPDWSLGNNEFVFQAGLRADAQQVLSSPPHR